MKICHKCGKKYEKVKECPHIVILDCNLLSIASYMEEFPESTIEYELTHPRTKRQGGK